MHVFIIYKNEDDFIKNEGARVVTTFSHYKAIGIYQDAQGEFTPQSNEEYPIKNEGARVFSTRYSNFSDAQCQIIQWKYLVKIQTHLSFHACPC